jgi:hypothetical protein
MANEQALAVQTRTIGDCDGKRHYPSRPRAERGLKALLREKPEQPNPRGLPAVLWDMSSSWRKSQSLDVIQGVL